MKEEDFDLLASMLKQRSGLMLTREKSYLLESRLMPVVRKCNLKSLEDMCEAIRAKRDENMLRDITEAMTTNESFFFRDAKPFTSFRKVLLPQLLAARAGKKQLRIWSAAASSGQEAYSLAMVCCDEAEKLQGWKVEIVGTDISREMIERAKAGIYSQFEVQRGLPIGMLIKYFQQLSADKWQIKEKVRQMVEFREGNLVQNFGAVGSFDVVFCRNVLVYFDTPTKSRVLDAIGQVMAPDGALLLGGSETVLGVSDKFKPMPSGEEGLFVLSGYETAAAQRAAL